MDLYTNELYTIHIFCKSKSVFIIKAFLCFRKIVVNKINKKKKKQTRAKTWVKISKVMPQSPHSIPQEREGSLMAKSLSPLAKTKMA